MSGKLGGEGKVVQIDESLFRGRRKYNRNRLLLDDFMESLDDARCKNNYGERVNGPWVFSMAEEGSRKVKMFVVEKRDRDSLPPLLLEHVDKNSIIHGDGCKAYSGLSTMFDDHKVVNYSENFVDPNTRCHIQLIECIWGQAKLKIIKNKRGTTLTMLQSHLSFFCFYYHFNEESFKNFLKTIGNNS
ncbi:hypothetical protein HERIO_1067 [Hepatospora eriocheir]|uniref:ISXO2-like transposase domain-containing protein n=1 Tax=Hepatospora eriocheir TaxID=1081669 RepID=A0A1X0QB76_9MICR|nr:hypothetical protein HERIO_1067 [Hepatospora eriocheir]